MRRGRKQLSWWGRLVRGLSVGTRLLMAALLIAAFALFLHFREVRFEIFDVDTIAKRDVIAEVAFDSVDREGTELLKQESLRDVGVIYRLEPKEVKEHQGAYEQHLAENQEWRRLLPQTTFEEMHADAAELRSLLQEAEFTDPRTIKRLELASVVDQNIYPFVQKSPGRLTALPNNVWKEMEHVLIKKDKASKPRVQYLIQFFKKTNWNLQADPTAQRTYRKQVEKGIPNKYVSIPAGTEIVAQGEKVTKRHVTLMQEMKRSLADKRPLYRPVTLAGSLIFAVFLIFVGRMYFRCYHEAFYRSNQKLALFVTIVLLSLLLAKVTEYFFVNNPHLLFETTHYPLLVPFATILLCVLFGPSIAFFTGAFLTVIFSVTLIFDPERFLITNLLASTCAILFSRKMRKRKEVFTVCGKVFLVVLPLIIAFYFVQNLLFPIGVLWDAISSVVFMGITAILIVGLLPIFESIFHVMTDITLMEYMDPSNELLKRLSLEAPGTYQHSLVVGSISEAAATAIGANGLFCRVATLYHDIGKLMNPHYFTENQISGFNIHQLLTPQESAQVIIAHVKEGEALARKHGLPDSFVDIIREHHGTTLAYYFYAKALEQAEGVKEAVDEDIFRYPGPKPRSKESAIIMIVDTVEAASRSIPDPSEDAIAELVNRLVKEKADSGQFDHCLLTFEELGYVKRTIIKTLAVTRHVRVKYPDRKTG